jgi:hypothetical protein
MVDQQGNAPPASTAPRFLSSNPRINHGTHGIPTGQLASGQACVCATVLDALAPKQIASSVKLEAN